MTRRLLAALERHWFAPASLRALALVRISLVGMFLVVTTLDAANRQLWLADADAAYFKPLPALKVLLLPFGWGHRPGPAFLLALCAVASIAGVFALVGYRTRLSLLALAYAHSVLVAHKFSYGDYHHPDALLVIMLWLLPLSPCGEAWSVDGLRRRLREARERLAFAPASPERDLSLWARWPVRTGQWLLALAYFSAALSKLRVGRLDWFNGDTLAYYLAQDGLWHHLPYSLWLSQFTWVGTVLAFLTVAFELCFFVAILVPEAAVLFVAVGLGLHTGIFVTQRAPFFYFMALYAVFFEPIRTTLRRRFPALRPAAPWRIIYDGLCPLCIRSMTVLDFLDGGGRLAYVDLERSWSQAEGLVPGLTANAARHRMHVVAPNGSVYRGFYAFRELTRALPALWPLRPFLYLPLVAPIGVRVYDRVAASRGRVACRVDTCAI